LTLVLATLATPAWAKQLQVYAYQTDEKVIVRADYGLDGWPAESAKVKVVGPDGKMVAAGQTNDSGQWSCARPADGDYLVVVETGGGPKAQTKITITPTVPAKVKIEYGGARPVFSPDGKTLAVAREKAVVLLDVETGKERAAFTGHRNHVDALAYSLDGKMLASASRDATIALWDVATGKEKHTLGLHVPARHLLFLPGGMQLACAFDDGQVYVWDVATQKLVVTTNSGGGKECACLWFVPATKSICTLAHMSRNNEDFALIFQCDVNTGEERANPDTRQRFSYPRGDWVLLSFFQGVAASPDGQTLAFRGAPNVAMPKSIKFWDVTAGKEKGPELSNASVTALAFSPDGKTLASTVMFHDIILWDLATGKEKRRLTGGQRKGGFHLAFSPDGTLVAVTQLGGVVDIWKIGDAKPKP
jgi:WD40 repeat protein